MNFASSPCKVAYEALIAQTRPAMKAWIPRNTLMMRIMISLQYASQIWERIRRTLRDSYRPEQHYMRGPGPKNRVRHLQNPDRR